MRGLKYDNVIRCDENRGFRARHGSRTWERLVGPYPIFCSVFMVLCVCTWPLKGK